jgi:hypothetical protein
VLELSPLAGSPPPASSPDLTRRHRCPMAHRTALHFTLACEGSALSELSNDTRSIDRLTNQKESSRRSVSIAPPSGGTRERLLSLRPVKKALAGGSVSRRCGSRRDPAPSASGERHIHARDRSRGARRCAARFTRARCGVCRTAQKPQLQRFPVILDQPIIQYDSPTSSGHAPVLLHH